MVAQRAHPLQEKLKSSPAAILTGKWHNCKGRVAKEYNATAIGSSKKSPTEAIDYREPSREGATNLFEGRGFEHYRDTLDP